MCRRNRILLHPTYRTSDAMSSRSRASRPPAKTSGRSPIRLTSAHGRRSFPSCWLTAIPTGCGLQRGLRRRCIEDDLLHLPIAFVKVVPIVEDEVHPILQRELPGSFRIGAQRARRSLVATCSLVDRNVSRSRIPGCPRRRAGRCSSRVAPPPDRRSDGAVTNTSPDDERSTTSG